MQSILTVHSSPQQATAPGNCVARKKTQVSSLPPSQVYGAPLGVFLVVSGNAHTQLKPLLETWKGSATYLVDH